MRERKTKAKPTAAHVPSIDWLACYKCQSEFNATGLIRHHMGEVLYHYTCPKCGLRTPTMSMVDINDWWNIRAG